MTRIKIDGTPIGCPAVHGAGYCPMCAGGWPGTIASSQSLVKAALKNRLVPGKLGCGTLVAQAEWLTNHLFWSAEDDYGIGPVGDGPWGPAVIRYILQSNGDFNS